MTTLVRGFHALYSQVYPDEGILIGGSPSRSGSGTYTTTEEVVAAVRDPRYKTDARYWEAHERKLAGSDLFRNGRAG